MPEKRLRAEATFKREGANLAPQARIPIAVRDHFDAQHGDVLVFDEGCEQAVTRAALKGRYFVVTLRREGLDNLQAVEPRVEAESKPEPLESLEEMVRRKLKENGKA